MLNAKILFAKCLPKSALFRLLLIHGSSGAVLGILFVAGILVLDVAGLYTLLSGTGEWGVGLALLLVGSITTCASVAMGGAIMLLPTAEERRQPPAQGLGYCLPVLSPAPARRRPASRAD